MRTRQAEVRCGPGAGALARATGVARSSFDTGRNGAAPAEHVTADGVAAERLSAERLTVVSAPASWPSITTLGALRGVGPPLRHQGGPWIGCAASRPNPAICLALNAARRGGCGADRCGQAGIAGLAAGSPPVGGRQRDSWRAAGIRAFEELWRV